MAVAVAQSNDHIQRCTTTDLAPVEAIANKTLATLDLRVRERIAFVASDFFQEDIPSSDVVIMSILLHDFPLREKMTLIRKAYAALPEHGVFVVIDSMIDDDRRRNTFAMCMSLNMLIEFGVDGGFDFTGSDLAGWCTEAGFARVEIRPLNKTHSMALAYKS